MSDALLLLRLEHRHADQLLTLVEQELALGKHCDMQVLADIAAYFLDYPDQCHHPVEDSVYRHLRKRAPDAAEDLGQLLEEHAYISEMSRDFAKLVDQAAAEPDAHREQLVADAAHFVKRYRSHMHEEERDFFALAEQILTDDDWAGIEFDLFDRADPLYDRVNEDRFRALRERIAASAGESFVRAATLRRARDLRELSDVASFNRWMAEANQDCALESLDQGGYVLRRGSEIVLDLPPCSEGRAAWCAWFFLQPATAPTGPAPSRH